MAVATSSLMDHRPTRVRGSVSSCLSGPSSQDSGSVDGGNSGDSSNCLSAGHSIGHVLASRVTRRILSVQMAYVGGAVGWCPWGD